MIRTVRRLLASGLGGLTGLACVLCCVIPLLLTAGVLSGAGWALLGQVLPGIAVGLATLTAAAWWWIRRLQAHATGCSGGNCSCAQSS